MHRAKNKSERWREERELLKRFKNEGDEEALLELVKSYQGVVKNRVYQMMVTYGVESDECFDEALSEGNIGLIEGFKRYNLDEFSEAKPSTYAWWWMRKRIDEHIKRVADERYRSVDYGENTDVIIEAKEDKRAEKAFELNKEGDDGSLDELFEKAGLTKEERQVAIRYANGQGQSSIADSLGMSVSWVSMQWRRVRDKIIKAMN